MEKCTIIDKKVKDLEYPAPVRNKLYANVYIEYSCKVSIGNCVKCSEDLSISFYYSKQIRYTNHKWNIYFPIPNFFIDIVGTAEYFLYEKELFVSEKVLCLNAQVNYRNGMKKSKTSHMGCIRHEHCLKENNISYNLTCVSFEKNSYSLVKTIIMEIVFCDDNQNKSWSFNPVIEKKKN